MLKIDNPDTYQLGAIVQKISKTGFTSNKRLLVLKTGMLYYYSNVPKQFKNDVKSLQGLNVKQLPKSSIQIRHILNIKTDPKKPKDLSICIQAQNIYERQDIMRKSGLSDEIGQSAKNNKTVIEWSFTFPNSQNQKIWAKSLELLKQHFKKQNDNVDKFFQSFNTDKKRVQNKKETSPRRASQKIQVVNRVSTENKHRQSQYDINGKNSKKLNIIQEQQEQNKQQQIQRQIKLREEKLKRDIEQKIRKQYENKMNENNKLIELQRQKKKQKQQKELEKQKILLEKQVQIKKLQQQLRKRIQQEQIKNRQLKQKQRQLKKSQQIQKSLQQYKLQASLKKNQQKKEQPTKKLLTQKSMINITKNQEKSPLLKKQQTKSIKEQKNIEIVQQKSSSVKMSKNNEEAKSVNKLPQKQQSDKLPNRNPEVKKELKWPTLKTSPTEPLISNPALNENTKQNDTITQITKGKQRQKSKSKKELLQDILSPTQTNEYNNKKNQNHEIKPNTSQSKQNKKLKSEKFYLERQIKKQIQQKKINKVSFQKKPNNVQPILKQPPPQTIKFHNTQQNQNKIQKNETQKLIQQEPKQFQKLKKLKQDFYSEFESNIYPIEQVEKINYFQIQNNIFKPSFEDKLQNQLILIKYVKSLKRQAINLFKNIVQQIQNQNTEKNFKLINNCYTDKNFTVQLGFCNTNVINLNGRNQYVYDQITFKNFRRYYQIYNQLQNKIILLLKKKPYFSIRVPLVFYLQYRGICGLITHIKYLNKQSLQEQLNENLVKQLNLIIDDDHVSNFKIRKIKGKQNLNILFLKESYRIDKIKYIDFNFPVTPFFLSKPNKFSLSTHTIKNIKYNLKQNPIPQNVQRIEALQITQFCKNIRKVYRAGQGELNDKVFWKLVLKKDPTIFNMLQTNLSCDFPKKGIFLQYLQNYLNIDICLQSYSQEVLNLTKIRQIQMNVIALEYKFNSIQVCQIIDNFDKYIKQNKLTLAKKSLSLKKDVCDPHENFQIQKYFTDKIHLLYFQSQYSSCTNQITILLQYIPYTSSTKLKFYQILFNCYKHLNQYPKFISTFKQSVQYVQITFGHNHPYLITLYCLLAQYVSTFGNIDESLEIYKHALDLSNKIYNNQQLSAQMYIQMSNIYINSKNFQQVVQLLNIILQLYKQVPENSETEAKLNIHVSTLYYLMGNFEDSQKLLLKAIQFYENENSSKYTNQQLFQSYLLYVTYFELNNSQRILLKIFMRLKNDIENNLKLIYIIMKKLLKNYNYKDVKSTIQILASRTNKNKPYNKQKLVSFLNEYQNILFRKIEEYLNALIYGELIDNNPILQLIGEDKATQILKLKS